MLKSLLAPRAGPAELLKRLFANMPEGIALKHIVSQLEAFAPTHYAEPWDNVGLLLEPYDQGPIGKILLTNDLTERVMKEAVDGKSNLIISYHPPIFVPLKRITQSNWKERIVSLCLSKSIALYSPHTAWDAVRGGVNDWLASALPCNDVKPIQPRADEPEAGAGRIFSTELTLEQAVDRVQEHIGLDVHVGLGVSHTLGTTIKTVAVCAGSGASVLKGVVADLYITGEMSHHDILEANHQGTSVILCNHSNSERGFLKVFKAKLKDMLDGQCEIIVAEADEDPLKTHVHGKRMK